MLNLLNSFLFSFLCQILIFLYDVFKVQTARVGSGNQVLEELIRTRLAVKVELVALQGIDYALTLVERPSANDTFVLVLHFSKEFSSKL